MDKILRIDMGAEGGPKLSEQAVGEYAGLGGRAMTSTIVAKEVPPTCHPLSGDNKLVIAPGILSGTAAAMSGRISVGCKSPLTGGIKEANSGGQGAQVLARLGYAAIVLEGTGTEENEVLRMESVVVAYNFGSAPFRMVVNSWLHVGCTLVYGNDITNAFPYNHTDHGGNIEADPLFCDRVEYLLQGDSPCLAGNHPDGIDCGTIGARGVGCGL